MNVLIDENTMKAIADAIRKKTGKTAKILPADMAAEIESINGSGSAGGDTGGGETTQHRIAITADGDPDYCYIAINGTKYYTVQYITVDSGTTIDLYASGLYSGSTITVDGSTVATGKPATHSIKATSGMVIELDAASTMRTYINVTMS